MRATAVWFQVHFYIIPLYYTVIAPVLEKQAGLTAVRYNESFSKINCQR